MPIALIVVLIIAILAALGFFATRTEAPSTTETVPTETVQGTPDTTTNEVVPETERTVAEPAPEVAEEIPVVSETTPAPTEPAVAANTYANGTYTSRVTYLTPRRTEHSLGVTLTIADDTVTDLSVVYDDAAGFANSHQERFDDDIDDITIGTSLETLSAARVGSASLTTDAFNEAVVNIRAEAAS